MKTRRTAQRELSNCSEWPASGSLFSMLPQERAHTFCPVSLSLSLSLFVCASCCHSRLLSLFKLEVLSAHNEHPLLASWRLLQSILYRPWLLRSHSSTAAPERAAQRASSDFKFSPTFNLPTAVALVHFDWLCG